MMAAERAPRLAIPWKEPQSRYVLVFCTGVRKGGRDCNRLLGYLNINHPHDVKYACRECDSEYVLLKS